MDEGIRRECAKKEQNGRSAQKMLGKAKSFFHPQHYRRERGTIEHLLVMPIRASEIAAAKVFASGLVILVAAGLTLALVFVHVLKVPVAGSIGLFLAGPAVYLFATTSMGILLGHHCEHDGAIRAVGDPSASHPQHALGWVSPLESVQSRLGQAGD